MKKIWNFIYEVSILFSFLGMLFIPFSFRIVQIQSKITQLVFEDLIIWIASFFDSIKIVNLEITSDSTTLFVLVFILLFLALVLILLTKLMKISKEKSIVLFQNIQLILVFYLSLVMLKYGFDKIFKVQFYLPEPNLLYTPLGLLEKDILYWSTIGSSYSYSVFIGLIEIIPAILLIFRKTRTLGLVMLVGVLVYVIAINFCYDISVKLYSSFLLLVSIVLLLPSIQALFNFFILGKTAQLPTIPKTNFKIGTLKSMTLKTTFIAIIFLECLFPYLKSNILNADNSSKFHLHGAYEVIKVIDLTSQKEVNTNTIKRLFFHQQNYFIVQYNNDTTEDYYLETNQRDNEFTLISYDEKRLKVIYNYSEMDKKLELNFIDLNVQITSNSLNWRKLPLLQPQFHWTVDTIE